MNKTSGNGKRSKFSSSPGLSVLLIFEIVQNVPQIEKVAEHRSGVSPLAKTNVAHSCRDHMAGGLKKLVSGPLEKYRSIQ